MIIEIDKEFEETVNEIRRKITRKCITTSYMNLEQQHTGLLQQQLSQKSH